MHLLLHPFGSWLLIFVCVFHHAFCCYTPLGGVGTVVPISNCTSIRLLLEQYRDNLPPRLSTFVEMSKTEQHDGQDMFCCGEAINLKESDGAAILRNFDNLCGDNVHKRISFGTDTTLLSYPWSVLLIYDPGQRFLCGGTLVTLRYVLTAAHCVKTTDIEIVAVRLGEHNTLTDPDCELEMSETLYCTAPVLDVNIEKVMPHERYSKFTYDHDIALIRLAQSVKFGRSVRPICLPAFQHDYERKFGIIAGWGATENNTHSNILIEADVPIFPLSHCQDVYCRSDVNWSHRLCAAGSDDIHTCNGDSGGPLMVRLDNGYDPSRKARLMQVGVISLGTPNCGVSRRFRTLPSVFTKVSAYMDWVAEKLEM